MDKEKLKMFNWEEFSKHLQKKYGKKSFRLDRLPKKHAQDFNELEKYIENWLNGIKMYEKQEAFDLLKDDFKSIKNEIDQFANNLAENE